MSTNKSADPEACTNNAAPQAHHNFDFACTSLEDLVGKES